MKRVLLALAFALFLAFSTTAQTTNGLSDAEIQGQQLAQEVLAETPVKDFDERAVLRIEDSKYLVTNTPLTSTTSVTNDYWETDYYAWPTNNFGATDQLQIIHKNGHANEYLFGYFAGTKTPQIIDVPIYINRLNDTQIMAPFAGSDFWICDLGLEFFHWPGQKVLKHETRRTRACAVLESTNPNPAPGSYSRVDSWIDNETLGIVHAEAYDANGKLLKEFDPKSFKKVNGQWELQNMEIRNVQTGSRTWIKFDLDNKS
jgi:hypothetical protein